MASYPRWPIASLVTLSALGLIACGESTATTSTHGGAGGAGSATASSAASTSGTGAGGATNPPPRAVWITAYYAGWMQAHLPVAEIDFSAISHVAHFAWTPVADGTIDRTSNGWSESQANAVVAAAHAAGKKALLTIGGAWSQDGFRAHIKPVSRAKFVATLAAAVIQYGYDGIDVDMEPVDDADAPTFGAFAKELRAALDATGEGRLLTAAVDWNKSAFVPAQSQFDQLNLMTYDMSGAWDGWETWHNSPLHNGGHKFQSTGEAMPSLETVVTRALADGAEPARLGIGGVFYGYVWKGANGPNQSIAGVTVTANKPYFEIMDTLYSPDAYRWHDGVEAPYLSKGEVGSASARFVSYDDETSLRKKIAWARDQGLGGMIVWELGGGHRPGLPKGKRDPLLDAVKAAAFP
jgi:chitinase